MPSTLWQVPSQDLLIALDSEFDLSFNLTPIAITTTIRIIRLLLILHHTKVHFRKEVFCVRGPFLSHQAPSGPSSQAVETDRLEPPATMDVDKSDNHTACSAQMLQW